MGLKQCSLSQGTHFTRAPACQKVVRGGDPCDPPYQAATSKTLPDLMQGTAMAVPQYKLLRLQMFGAFVR